MSEQITPKHEQNPTRTGWCSTCQDYVEVIWERVERSARRCPICPDCGRQTSRPRPIP